MELPSSDKIAWILSLIHDVTIRNNIIEHYMRKETLKVLQSVKTFVLVQPNSPYKEEILAAIDGIIELILAHQDQFFEVNPGTSATFMEGCGINVHMNIQEQNSTPNEVLYPLDQSFNSQNNNFIGNQQLINNIQTIEEFPVIEVIDLTNESDSDENLDYEQEIIMDNENLDQLDNQDEEFLIFFDEDNDNSGNNDDEVNLNPEVDDDYIEQIIISVVDDDNDEKLDFFDESIFDSSNVQRIENLGQPSNSGNKRPQLINIELLENKEMKLENPEDQDEFPQNFLNESFNDSSSEELNSLATTPENLIFYPFHSNSGSELSSDISSVESNLFSEDESSIGYGTMSIDDVVPQPNSSSEYLGSQSSSGVHSTDSWMELFADEPINDGSLEDFLDFFERNENELVHWAFLINECDEEI